MIKKLFFTLLCLSSCSTLSLDSFSGTNPSFKIEEYFNGYVKGTGVVLDRSGMPIRQFIVDLNGQFDNSKELFVLNEDFTYSDGKKENRVWEIKILDEHNYQGFAKDVVGFADGKSNGQALHWSYTLNVPYDSSTIKVDFNDWMFLQSDKKTLVNKAVMTKFGIYVGEVLLFFSKN